MTRHLPPTPVNRDESLALQLAQLRSHISNLQTPQTTGTAARAYRLAAVGMAVGLSAVPLDKVAFDPGAHFDLVNHRYVVPNAGIYHVDGQISTSLNNNPQDTIVGVLLNGNYAIRGSRYVVHGGTAGDLWYLTVSGLIEAAEGDHIELGCNNGGANGLPLEVVGGSQANYLSVHRVV